MVILIGGSSHVGKTLMAQKLMECCGIPYISLDHLKMGFIRTGMTDLTVNDDLKMRYWMWPYVAEIIKTAVENGQQLILEGCYIPGEWAESFTEEYLREIRCVFIVMSEEYIRSHRDDLTGYADVIEKRINDTVDIDRLVMCSRNFAADCSRYGIPCIEITDRYDPEQLLEQIRTLAGL